MLLRRRNAALVLAAVYILLVTPLPGCKLFGGPRWATPAADSGFSRVVVYRPGSLTGFAKRYMLAMNDDRMAFVGNGEYFVMDVLPARHMLSLEGSGEGDEVRRMVQALAGEVHYLRMRVTKRQDKLRAVLEPVDVTTAQKELPPLEEAEPWQPTEETEAMYKQSAGPR